MSDGSAAAAAVEEVVRTSYGRLVAVLAAGSRDLAAAEDALGEAVVAALRTWDERGVPERPDAWLLTAARRTLVDAARRRATATRALPALARLAEAGAPVGAEPGGDAPDVPDDPEGAIPDVRLELLFACAHPAIAEGVRSPLMLQAVLGLDAARIASAFLVSPTAMGQRLVRAKAKIKEAAVPFAVPPAAQLPARLEAVLDAIYAAYGTGWDDPAGRDERRRGLTAEALRLARLVAELLPDEPEAHGLLAALLHAEARAAARLGPQGEFVPLDRQDVRLWSRETVGEAERHLGLAYARRAVGPYQLQAAIQSVHNRRALTGSTDWTAIAALYDGLVALTGSIGARTARASAHLHAGQAAAALAMLDELAASEADAVAGYQPYWVVRAHCLRRTGDAEGAARAAAVALGLTEDPAVRDHLRRTLG